VAVAASYDELIRRLREPSTGILDLVTVKRRSTGEVIETYDPLYREAADALESARAERDRLNNELGNCQRIAIKTVAEVSGERFALRALLLDMRQHQGAIQPYIKRIDAALAAQEQGNG
jgi:hypothetical protein